MGEPFSASAGASAGGASAGAGSSAAAASAGTASASAASAGTASASAAAAGTAAAGATTAAAAGTAGLFTSASGAFSLMQTLSTIGNISSIVSGITTIGGARAKAAALKGAAEQFSTQARRSEVQALQDAINIRSQTLQRLASARASGAGSKGVEDEYLRLGQQNIDRVETTGLLNTLQQEQQAGQYRAAAKSSTLAEYARGASLIAGGSKNIKGDL